MAGYSQKWVDGGPLYDLHNFPPRTILIERIAPNNKLTRNKTNNVICFRCRSFAALLLVAMRGKSSITSKSCTTISTADVEWLDWKWVRQWRLDYLSLNLNLLNWLFPSAEPRGKREELKEEDDRRLMECMSFLIRLNGMAVHCFLNVGRINLSWWKYQQSRLNGESKIAALDKSLWNDLQAKFCEGKLALKMIWIELAGRGFASNWVWKYYS